MCCFFPLRLKYLLTSVYNIVSEADHESVTPFCIFTQGKHLACGFCYSSAKVIDICAILLLKKSLEDLYFVWKIQHYANANGLKRIHI